MTVRQLMIERMLEQLTPLSEYRYGRFFYEMKEPVDKRARRHNERAEQEGKINVKAIPNLSAEDLFVAYNRFMARYCAQM